MAETIYTKKTHAQWRGPTTSDKYNERIESNYKDIINLINRLGLTEEAQSIAARRFMKDHYAMTLMLLDVEERLQALEDDRKIIAFHTDSQIDNDRFDDTVYEVVEVDTLFHDSDHGLLTLPQVPSSSSSKVYFTNTNGENILPPSFEAVVKGGETSLDSQAALISTTDHYQAFYPDADLVWERSIIVDAPDSGGAVVELYVRLPLDLLANSNSNNIVIHPFPIMGCELVEVAVSTKVDVVLNEADNYVALNGDNFFIGDDDAVGWIPPGAWNGDSIPHCGPKSFYFNPKGITAVRVILKQTSYFTESAKYIYSYGLSKLDVRYQKFLDEGKIILRFDAPGGDTISSIDNVLPQVFNVNPAELPSVFSYRVLWETSNNSGVYTTTPVAFSSRVWIEVTLKKTVGQGSPVVSGLVVSYS